MHQGKVWEKEYRKPRLVTGDAKPQKFILRFLKYLKKQDFSLDKAKVLDLGSGIGKAANYIAGLGAEVFGLEISETAIKNAKNHAKKIGVNVKYFQKSIGNRYQFEDDFFDVVIDATSSNSLNIKEREVYLREVKRVMKNNGYFFVRSFRKNGDKNAKKLLKEYPGKEKNT